MEYIFDNYRTKEAQRAFILDANSLTRIYDYGREWITKEEGSNVSYCEAKLTNCNDSIVGDTITPILNCSNTKKQNIKSILLYMKSKNGREYQIRFMRSPEDPTILFKIQGEEEAETTKMYDRVTAEIKELNQWYSFLSNRVMIYKLLIKCRWILYIISIILTILAIRDFNRWHKIKPIAKDSINKLEEIKKQIDETGDMSAGNKNTREVDKINNGIKNLKYIDENNYFIMVMKGVTHVLIGVLFILFLNKGLIYLFPRGVILIGAEIKRHETLLTIRKSIYGVLITIFTSIVTAIIVKSAIKK